VLLGQLDRLCQWLDLPKLVLLSPSASNEEDIAGLVHEGVAGVIVVDADPAISPLQYILDFEVYYGIAVVGVMYRTPPENVDLAGTFTIWREGRCQVWWNDSQFERILRTSVERPISIDEWPVLDYRGRITVAIARDSVFGCYFPETLESLERCGARVVDFSPIRDERIPEETDVIYLGCGQPDSYASDLAANHCLKASIRNHVRRGGKVYAEGAGAAYLCQWMEIRPGQFIRGVGLFSAAGRRLPRYGAPMPVSVTTTRSTWLTERGTTLRGYRSPEWWFQPEALSAPLIAEPGFEYDILGNERVVASAVHLDFSAHPELLASFFASRYERRLLPRVESSATHRQI